MNYVEDCTYWSWQLEIMHNYADHFPNSIYTQYFHEDDLQFPCSSIG